MFEDDPPPLPSTPCIETICDSTFADLYDHDRFTAVADDDYDEVDAKFRSHVPPILQTDSDSEFVNPETAVPHTKSTEANETPDSIQNLVIKTMLHNGSDEEQNPPSSSLQSQSHQSAQISKPRGLSPEISGDPEDLDLVKNFITTDSAQEDRTISSGSQNIPAFEKGRKDSILAESTEDETKGNSDLQHFDLIGGNEKAVVIQSALQNVEDDDEFVQEETQKSENDNWADFGSLSLPDPDIKNKSTGGITCSRSELQFTAETSLLPTLLEVLCDHQLWTDFARAGKNNDEHDIFDRGLCEALRDTINSKGKDRPDEMVWKAVSIIEEARALKLQWHDSFIRSCFLHSLDVDVNQTVIRNSDLPVFAQQLEESTVLAPVSVVESCGGVINEKNPSSINQQSPSRSITIDSLAVPPVHFDWNNSGLTNPLKTGSLSVSSASLDLDFLVSINSRGSSADGSPTMQVSSTLQKDLTAFGLNLPDDAGKSKNEKDISSSTSIVLDYILNKNDDKRKYKPVNELSLDARALHDQLPDLDYMLSNVLLFPVVDR